MIFDLLTQAAIIINVCTKLFQKALMYSYSDTLLIEGVNMKLGAFEVTFFFRHSLELRQINFYSNLFARTFPKSRLKIEFALKLQTFLTAPSNYYGVYLSMPFRYCRVFI